ncbi:MAG: YebC/PmpR family DNA-binding transcriptional regulator [Spirochaetia bacterium]|nr:YebC/PmpR family DNA-binding transcriptional regulator [Spirochaetia bacterium]
MSGHSKWSTIKHKKGAADAKRGKIFTKIGKEIMVAVKQGGPAEESNAALRAAIIKARAANMPKDNIDRAIKKASGENDGVVYTQLTYEGYVPGGVALIIETLTDNKNRTAADVRSTLSKNGGSLGTAGSSSYLFQRKGIISIQTPDFDKVFEIAGDAGAEDVIQDDDYVEVITDPADFEAVSNALSEAGFTPEEAEVKMEPITRVTLDSEGTAKALRLIEKLEDLDDVQSVFNNLEIPDDFEGDI